MTKPFRVLIVEDHDPHRQILAELMQARGWDADPTDQVPEALELARANRPDIALLDFHLAGSTGLELFQALSSEIGPLPSIMMSGEATPSETDAALDAGVFSFLRKPFEIRHLQRTLDLLLARHFPAT